MNVFFRLILRDIKRALKTLVGKGDKYSWEKFHKEARSKGCNLLRELKHFENPVLVSGCQRSGTTVLARVIIQSEGMVSHWVSKDDELDGARILSGLEDYQAQGRHCFQTTYLNECYHEYYEAEQDFKLIWVLRNPYSVVYSMHNNWGRFSFNELFEACGYAAMPADLQKKYDRFGRRALSRIERACYSYNGKVNQALELDRQLPDGKMLVIDYDDLIANKNKMLPGIYEFIGLDYDPRYSEIIHGRSIAKSDKLTSIEREIINKISMPVYEHVKSALISKI